jgi:hypothetical protein
VANGKVTSIYLPEGFRAEVTAWGRSVGLKGFGPTLKAAAELGMGKTQDQVFARYFASRIFALLQANSMQITRSVHEQIVELARDIAPLDAGDMPEVPEPPPPRVTQEDQEDSGAGVFFGLRGKQKPPKAARGSSKR